MTHYTIPSATESNSPIEGDDALPVLGGKTRLVKKEPTHVVCHSEGSVLRESIRVIVSLNGGRVDLSLGKTSLRTMTRRHTEIYLPHLLFG